LVFCSFAFPANSGNLGAWGTLADLGGSHVAVLKSFAAVRFSYVSTFQVLDPKDMAQNLRKQASLVASLVDTLGANELA
jgi:hypothetical protein